MLAKISLYHDSNLLKWGEKIIQYLNSSIVNTFLIFTEFCVWQMKVISASGAYIVDIRVSLKFSNVVHYNNERKNSLANGR